MPSREQASSPLPRMIRAGCKSSRRRRNQLRLAVESLEPRYLLSFDSLGDAFVHNDPLLGVDQSHVRIAASPIAPQDTFVTVFQAAGRDGDGLGVFAQIHSAAQLSTIQVNTTSAGDQSHPDAAIFSDGSFVVTWQGPSTEAGDSSVDVFFRRFSGDGTELTAETRVNSTLVGDQSNPVVASNSGDDRFLVAWQGPGSDGSDIFAQFFASDATTDGTEQTVNTTVAGDQLNPDVAMVNGFGDRAIVVWEGVDVDGSGIQAQLFSDAVPRADEILVNPFAVSGNQRNPRVAISDSLAVVSFVGPFDSVTGLEAIYGSTIGDDGQDILVNDFLVSQGGLNPIGGHDVAIVDQDRALQMVFAWANGNQITLSQYEGLSFGDARAVPTFVSRQLVPLEVDAVDGLSDSQLVGSDLALAATLDSTASLFTDGLLLAANPLATTAGNDPARQSVLWDFDVDSEQLINNIDSGFTARVAVFDDINGDGIQDAGEDPIEGFTFFVDSNGNGVQDPLLALEDFTIKTNSRGEATIYNRTGLIPMSPLLDEDSAVSTAVTGSLVISHATPLGTGEEVTDIGAFNPFLVDINANVRAVTSTGRTSVSLIRFVDRVGREITFDNLRFEDNFGNLLTYVTESRLSGKPLFTTRLFHRPQIENGQIVIREADVGTHISSTGAFLDANNVLDGYLTFNPTSRAVEVGVLGDGLGDFLAQRFLGGRTIPFSNPPTIAPDERLFSLGSLYLNGDGLTDAIAVVQRADGGFELRTYLNTGQRGWSDPTVQEIETQGEVQSVAIRRGSLSLGNTDIVLNLVEKRNDGSIDVGYVSLISLGNGLFGQPTFAAAVIPGSEDLAAALTDATGDGFTDLINEITGKGQIQLRDGFPVPDPVNPTAFFGGTRFDIFDVLGSQVIKDIAAVGRSVLVATDRVLAQFSSSTIPDAQAGLTTSVGIARKSALPGGDTVRLQGRVELGATGADGIIIRAETSDGTIVGETVTSSIDLNQDGQATTGVFQLDVAESVGPLTITTDLSGGFGVSVLAPNFDVVSPTDRSITVDPTLCPCILVSIIIGRTSQDFGDAPDSYGTLGANDGARHNLTTNVVLGTVVEGEFEGQPPGTVLAGNGVSFGDDDGVAFLDDLVAGQSVDLAVYVPVESQLDAFIDFDGDGQFQDPLERLFGGSQLVTEGINEFTIDVPAGAVTGDTYARFRVSSTGGLGPTGEAADGEVEDYAVTLRTALNPFDFGDAPAPYPTLLADDGARHQIDPLGPSMESPDAEFEGQPTLTADGDDNSGSDDEQAVAGISSLVATEQGAGIFSFSVNVEGTGKLDAWIDFNRDGDWLDLNEQILTSVDVSAGFRVFARPLPLDTVPGLTFARFRISTDGGLSPVGEASDGEVEDYQIEILDGDAAPAATVNVVNQNASLSVQSDRSVVTSDSTTLFASPINSLGSLRLIGTASDESFSVDVGTDFALPINGYQFDGGGGQNSLAALGDGGTLDLTDPLIVASDFSTLDLTHPDNNTIAVDGPAIARLVAAGNVLIILEEDDTITVVDADDWRMSDPIVRDGKFILQADNSLVGGGESIEAIVPRPWQNFLRASDINDDGSTSILDALLIVNELGRRVFSDAGTGNLVDPLTVQVWPGVYYDQNGDTRVSALDALRVINERARQLIDAGEGERPLLQIASVDFKRDITVQGVTSETESPQIHRLAGDQWVRQDNPSSVTRASALEETEAVTQGTIRAVDQLLADDAFFWQVDR